MRCDAVRCDAVRERNRQWFRVSLPYRPTALLQGRIQYSNSVEKGVVNGQAQRSQRGQLTGLDWTLDLNISTDG